MKRIAVVIFLAAFSSLLSQHASVQERVLTLEQFRAAYDIGGGMPEETWEKHVPKKFVVPLGEDGIAKLVAAFNKSGGVPFTVEGGKVKRKPSNSLIQYEPLKGKTEELLFNEHVHVLDLEQNGSRYVFLFMNLSPVSRGISIWRWDNSGVKLLLLTHGYVDGLTIQGDSDLTITAADPITVTVIQFSKKEKKLVPVVMYDAHTIGLATPEGLKGLSEPEPFELTTNIPGGAVREPDQKEYTGSTHPLKAGTRGWVVARQGDWNLVYVRAPDTGDHDDFSGAYMGKALTGGWVKKSQCKMLKPAK